MQIIHLHKNIYKLYSWARPQETLDIYRKLYEDSVKSWEKLKKEGVSDEVAAEFSAMSRATYFRRKRRLKELREGMIPPSKKPKRVRQSTFPDSVAQLVLTLRRENPTYGKAKISVIICRDHNIKISESSVGRILKKLMAKGLVTTSLSALRPKRKRLFNKHAKRWTFGMKASSPGQLIQIDHMTVTKNQITVKHFQAWDPITKVIIAQVYSNATSSCAKKFLSKVIEEMPFNIKSIQVDGGSEFMYHFEEDCKKRGIPLFVLPPKMPKYNGGVERGNRIFREEFYARRDLLADSVGNIKAELKKAVQKYNSYRPHFNLKGLTPFQYAQNILKVAA